LCTDISYEIQGKHNYGILVPSGEWRAPIMWPDRRQNGVKEKEAKESHSNLEEDIEQYEVDLCDRKPRRKNQEKGDKRG